MFVFKLILADTNCTGVINAPIADKFALMRRIDLDIEVKANYNVSRSDKYDPSASRFLVSHWKQPPQRATDIDTPDMQRTDEEELSLEEVALRIVRLMGGKAATSRTFFSELDIADSLIANTELINGLRDAYGIGPLSGPQPHGDGKAVAQMFEGQSQFANSTIRVAVPAAVNVACTYMGCSPTTTATVTAVVGAASLFVTMSLVYSLLKGVLRAYAQSDAPGKNKAQSMLWAVQLREIFSRPHIMAMAAIGMTVAVWAMANCWGDRKDDAVAESSVTTDQTQPSWWTRYSRGGGGRDDWRSESSGGSGRQSGGRVMSISEYRHRRAHGPESVGSVVSDIRAGHWGDLMYDRDYARSQGPDASTHTRTKGDQVIEALTHSIVSVGVRLRTKHGVVTRTLTGFAIAADLVMFPLHLLGDLLDTNATTVPAEGKWFCVAGPVKKEYAAPLNSFYPVGARDGQDIVVVRLTKYPPLKSIFKHTITEGLHSSRKYATKGVLLRSSALTIEDGSLMYHPGVLPAVIPVDGITTMSNQTYSSREGQFREPYVHRYAANTAAGDCGSLLVSEDGWVLGFHQFGNAGGPHPSGGTVMVQEDLARLIRQLGGAQRRAPLWTPWKRGLCSGNL